MSGSPTIHGATGSILGNFTKPSAWHAKGRLQYGRLIKPLARSLTRELPNSSRRRTLHLHIEIISFYTLYICIWGFTGWSLPQNPLKNCIFKIVPHLVTNLFNCIFIHLYGYLHRCMIDFFSHACTCWYTTLPSGNLVGMTRIDHAVMMIRFLIPIFHHDEPNIHWSKLEILWIPQQWTTKKLLVFAGEIDKTSLGACVFSMSITHMN